VNNLLRAQRKKGNFELIRWRSSVASQAHVFGATRGFLVLATLIGLFVPCALADRMYCYQKVIEPGADGGGRIHVSGFTIEVKPIPDPNVSGNTLCQASVTGPEGKIVYSFDDWGAEIDRISGKDINGDGEPDVVLVSYSGGAHCCWTYHIISLGKKPGLIREFENRDTASFEDLKGNGQLEIVIRDGTFDFGFGLDHASSVFPVLIVQLQGSEFLDVSSDFWPTYEKEIQQARENLTDGRIQEFLHSEATGNVYELEHERTKSSILLVFLDYLYGGKQDEAKKLLNKWWPLNSQEQTWSEIMTGYCSGLRAQLGIATDVPCTGKIAALHRLSTRHETSLATNLHITH